MNCGNRVVVSAMFEVGEGELLLTTVPFNKWSSFLHDNQIDDMDNLQAGLRLVEWSVGGN